MRSTTLLLVWLVLLPAATPAAQRETLLTAFDQRKVAVIVPEGFNLTRASEAPRGLNAVTIDRPDGAIALHLYFIPDPTGGELVQSARARKEFLVSQFQDYVAASTEAAMQFEELDARGASSGTYCAFTDSSLLGKTQLPPNEFLHVTVGLKAWPEGCVMFKLFSNDLTSPHYRALLDLLRDGLQLKPLTPLK